MLTQSFNTMTRQIADATEAMERNQLQLENAKTYLESILSNLTSGVLTFDERGLGLRGLFPSTVADRLGNVTAAYDPDGVFVANQVAG